MYWRDIHFLEQCIAGWLYSWRRRLNLLSRSPHIYDFPPGAIGSDQTRVAKDIVTDWRTFDNRSQLERRALDFLPSSTFLLYRMQQMCLIVPKPKRLYSIASLTKAISSQSQEVLGDMWWVTQSCHSKTQEADCLRVVVQRPGLQRIYRRYSHESLNNLNWIERHEHVVIYHSQLPYQHTTHTSCTKWAIHVTTCYKLVTRIFVDPDITKIYGELNIRGIIWAICSISFCSNFHCYKPLIVSKYLLDIVWKIGESDSLFFV